MHAENILALLNATRCERCGRAAVPGVTRCLPCAAQLNQPERDHGNLVSPVTRLNR